MKKILAFILVVTLILGSAILGAYIGASLADGGGEAAAQVSNELMESASSAALPNQIVISSSDISTTITQVVEQVGPAVVTVVGETSGQMTIFGYSGDQEVSGSGFIITADGYIITNNHVVEDTEVIQVILSDGTELPAEVISTDSFADLAVLKAEGVMPGVAVLGDSGNLKPGETVIAIGSPLGDFRNSVTVGVVSATGRSLDTGSGYEMENLIQTDAAINSGNSGGPLVNLAGEVIGINTLVVRGSGSSSGTAEGLGFAVPANTARAIADQIMQKGYFARPYLGIRYQWITPDIASMYELPVKWGAYIAQLDEGSPAVQAGLQRGDIITKIGEQVLDDSHPYINALFAQSPGEQVTLEVVRGRKTGVVDVVLGESQ